MRRLKEICKVALATVAAVGLFGGALLGANLRSLHAATSEETYLPQTVEYVSIPDNPVPEEEDFQALNVTIINITHEDVRVNPLALSLEDAAHIGAQYIYDIFGKCIYGMYVELEFIEWQNMTRTIWRGVVSENDRDTLARMAALYEISQQLNDEINARIEAGEDPYIVRRDMHDISLDFAYVQGDFYFTIDAITGERIDVSRPMSRGRMTVLEYRTLTDYLEREWYGRWEQAFVAELPRQETEELLQIAKEAAQRHFVNTSLVESEHVGSFAIFKYAGNGGFDRLIYVSFNITDETGRVAGVTVSQQTREVTDIGTMRNDILPIDAYFTAIYTYDDE